MAASILIVVDDVLRLKVSGLNSKGAHELLSHLRSYFRKKYGPDQKIIIHDLTLTFFSDEKNK